MLILIKVLSPLTNLFVEQSIFEYTRREELITLTQSMSTI